LTMVDAVQIFGDINSDHQKRRELKSVC